MKRLLKWRRLRWLAAGAVVRVVLRRTAARSVDRAASDLEERLPEPVRRALEVMPADAARLGGSAVRLGGSAVVAGRTARRVAVGSRRASQVATEGSRRFTHGLRRVRSIGDEISYEADLKQRELKAEYLRMTRGNAAGDDALLDLRPKDASFDIDPKQTEAHRWIDDERPEILPSARSGRWRAAKALRTPAVNRVQRSYRPRPRPWDR